MKGNKRYGRLASKEKDHGNKNGTRGTKLKSSSLTFPWKILGTKSLSMGRGVLNWICIKNLNGY
jgi:hypothetical protein